MLINLKVLLGAGRTDNVMKTKALFLSIVALLMSATLSAQTIIKGDMNDDKQVSIADVTSLVNVILGKAPMETLSVECEPYKVDNSLVVGTWYAPDGTSFMFNADGTTTFPDGATYEFMPLQGRLLLYDAANKPVKVLPILKAESEFLLTVDYATSHFTYYTKSNPVEPQEEKLYWYVGTTLPNESNIVTIANEMLTEKPTTWTSDNPKSVAATNNTGESAYIYYCFPTDWNVIVLDGDKASEVLLPDVSTFTYNNIEYTVKRTGRYIGNGTTKPYYAKC